MACEMEVCEGSVLHFTNEHGEPWHVMNHVGTPPHGIPIMCRDPAMSGR